MTSTSHRTSVRVGWAVGIGAFAALAGLSLATTFARNADPSSYTTDAGGLMLLLLLGVGPTSLAVGLFASALAGTREGRWAALMAALASFALLGAWSWLRMTESPRQPEEDPLRFALELVQQYILTGTMFALAAAVVVWWIVRHATGGDGPERLLGVSTAALRGSRDEWGRGMRAELASIDPPADRAGFARSAAVFAVRRGTGPLPGFLAIGVGLSTGIVAFAASRIAFSNPDGARGVIGEPVMALVPLLLIVAVVAATLRGRSFRAGLETALLAWLAAWSCWLAVTIPEAIRWYADAGVYLLDGDAIGITPDRAALEPLTHWAFQFMWMQLLVYAVLAAAFGAAVLRAGWARARRHPHRESVGAGA